MSQREVARFEQIVLPHLDDAYTFARYLLRDEHDAQDAVQEAALRALRHVGGYRDGDARAWLLAIVRNCCLTLQHKRRDHEARHPDDAIEMLPSRAPATDARAIRSSDRALLERAVAALPTEFREVIVLREVHDLSYKEISRVTGAPLGTVMSRLARARERLAIALRPTQEAG